MPGTNCKSIFLIEKPGFNGYLKIFGAQNQLTITFWSDLVCNKTLMAINSIIKRHTHEFLTFNIPIYIKSEQKMIALHINSNIFITLRFVKEMLEKYSTTRDWSDAPLKCIAWHPHTRWAMSRTFSRFILETKERIMLLCTFFKSILRTLVLL